MRKRSMEELERLSAEDFHHSVKNPVILILDNIRSMHNVGSVFRSADAFRVESIFLCGYTPQPPHRDIHKTALGATETVQWMYFSDPIEAVAEARKRGFSIWAVEQTDTSTSPDMFVAGLTSIYTYSPTASKPSRHPWTWT